MLSADTYGLAQIYTNGREALTMTRMKLVKSSNSGANFTTADFCSCWVRWSKNVSAQKKSAWACAYFCRPAVLHNSGLDGSHGVMKEWMSWWRPCHWVHPSWFNSHDVAAQTNLTKLFLFVRPHWDDQTTLVEEMAVLAEKKAHVHAPWGLMVIKELVVAFAHSSHEWLRLCSWVS